MSLKVKIIRTHAFATHMLLQYVVCNHGQLVAVIVWYYFGSSTRFIVDEILFSKTFVVSLEMQNKLFGIPWASRSK